MNQPHPSKVFVGGLSWCGTRQEEDREREERGGERSPPPPNVSLGRASSRKKEAPGSPARPPPARARPRAARGSVGSLISPPAGALRGPGGRGGARAKRAKRGKGGGGATFLFSASCFLLSPAWPRAPRRRRAPVCGARGGPRPSAPGRTGAGMLACAAHFPACRRRRRAGAWRERSRAAAAWRVARGRASPPQRPRAGGGMASLSLARLATGEMSLARDGRRGASRPQRETEMGAEAPTAHTDRPRPAAAAQQRRRQLTRPLNNGRRARGRGQRRSWAGKPPPSAAAPPLPRGAPPLPTRALPRLSHQTINYTHTPTPTKNSNDDKQKNTTQGDDRRAAARLL